MVFVIACFSSWPPTNECLGWLIPTAVALPGVFHYGRKWLWRHTWYQDDNFGLVFINNPPAPAYANASVDEPPSLKILPCGSHKLFIRVWSRFGFRLKTIDLRFMNRDGSNAHHHLVTVSDMEDYFYPLRRLPNGIWGIEADYMDRDVFVLARGAGLYFQVTLNGSQPWSGRWWCCSRYLGLCDFRLQNSFS